MAEVDADSCLPGVAGLAGDSAQEFRTGCHRLAMSFAIHKSGIEAPPVVDLGDEAGSDLAAVEVLRGEPGPPPLIFEFIEGIFGIASFAVKGDKGGRLVRHRGHQDDVFVGDEFHGQLAALAE